MTQPDTHRGTQPGIQPGIHPGTQPRNPPSIPRVGVLALQGDVREHERVLVSCGAEPVRVRSAQELDSVQALVIPGGESTTMSKLAVDVGLIGPLRQARASGMPMYGSCAGMIMLADRLEGGRADQQTIGGIDMTVRRNAFGRQVDSFEADLQLKGIDGPPVHAVFIRAPWVESVGPAVEVLGLIEVLAGAAPSSPASHSVSPSSEASGGAVSTNDAPSGQGQAAGAAVAGKIVAVRQGSLIATSFHPELTGDHRMHQYFIDLVRATT